MQPKYQSLSNYTKTIGFLPNKHHLCLTCLKSMHVTQQANSTILQTNDFNVSIPPCTCELGTISERTKGLMSWMAYALLWRQAWSWQRLQLESSRMATTPDCRQWCPAPEWWALQYPHRLTTQAQFRSSVSTPQAAAPQVWRSFSTYRDRKTQCNRSGAACAEADQQPVLK